MADVFDPIMIGTMEVKNRIVAAPMVSNSATEDGNVTPKMVAYYAEKARGGFGLVHVEASYIRPDGKGDFARMHGAYDDRQITGLSELAAAIKENGAKSCIQLLHSGREASPRMTKTQPIAPSAVPWAGVVPKVMTPEDIEEMIQCYVEACLRCQAAGFDAVMLHGAHGFLIGEFASPYTNRREDEYGQDRYLFAKQLVRRVKEACGEDYPVLMRISGDEHLGDQGLTIDEVADSYAPALEEAGVDALDVSSGIFETGTYIIQPCYWPRAVILPLAEKVKQTVSIPVTGGGRVNDPKLIRDIITKERVDLVWLGRQSLADPETPRKMFEGRDADVRKCIACDLGCTYRHIASLLVDCAVNAQLLHEERQITPAPMKKKVMVIGGGVGGMEAARVAHLRGHDVTLYEAKEELGGITGKLRLPRLYTSELTTVVPWQIRQLQKLGVKMITGHEVTLDFIRQENPDAVIVATGSTPTIPDLPGANGNVITLIDYISGERDVGDRIVILGGQEGAEVAASLGRQGKNVTILEESEEIAATTYLLHLGRRTTLHGYLLEYGVNVLTGVTVQEITDEGVRALVPPQKTVSGRPAWAMAGSYVAEEAEGAGDSGDEAREKFFEADTVILALGRKPNDYLGKLLKNGKEGLYPGVRGQVPEIYEIGDCTGTDSIRHSVHSGFVAGLQV